MVDKTENTEVVEAVEMFVCNINLTGRYKTPIPAGSHFSQDELVTHTFESLKRQGHITSLNLDHPIQPMGKPEGRLLVGLNSTTPKAAINPPVLSHAEKLKRNKEDALNNAEAIAKKAKKDADKAEKKADTATAVVNEEKQAQEKAKTAEASKAKTAEQKKKKEDTVEKIWIMNPKDLEKYTEAELLDAYTKTCAQYKIDPKRFNKDNHREELIKQLSSDFKSS